MVDPFHTVGWKKFPFDHSVMNWVLQAMPSALRAVQDPQLRAQWLRCGQTWFVGVNALENDAMGRVENGPALRGGALDFIRTTLGFDQALDRAQVSVVWPGYPRRDAGESEASFRFRQDRDAAHVDGVKPFTADRRRHVGECHSYLLGVPLNETAPGASPMVAWEGSHTVMRAALRAALKGVAPEEAGKVDVTQAYSEARRRVFETCRRVTLHARPGEAYLLHRLTVHGVSPWQAGAQAPGGEGRMIAYFRPPMAGGAKEWLRAP